MICCPGCLSVVCSLQLAILEGNEPGWRGRCIVCDHVWFVGGRVRPDVRSQS